MIEAAYEVLSEGNPMTVRQVYYQLVAKHVIKNTRSRYQAVSNALRDARKEGLIPWEWIEDRMRKPRQVTMWDDLPEFISAVRRSYRRDVWGYQPHYLEAWLEKDALSGIFEDVLEGYGVTLNVGRGFDGWDSIKNAAARFGSGSDSHDAAILYFGDFDPSGEAMVHSLRERLAFFGCEPELIKCALTFEDISRYQLPPDFTKASDTRSKAFVEQWGDVAVELDALPIDVLRERLVREVEAHMDLDALERVRDLEREDEDRLNTLLGE
jgi:hypothetical protein